MAGPTTGGGWSILGILKALGLVAAAGATGYMFSGSGDGIRLGDTDNSNKISIKPISNESSDRTVYMPTLGGDKYLVISSTDGGTPAGLGTMSTQNANAVAITGGTVTGITDLAVADGGTGSSTAAAARTALAVAGTGTTNTFTADQTMTGGANALTVGTPTTADATADTVLAASATTQTPFVIQGKASQTANLLEVQDSSGNKTVCITGSGARLLFSGDSGPYDIYFENSAQANVFKAMQSVTGTRKILVSGFSNNSDLGFGGKYFLFTDSAGTDVDGGLERDAAGVLKVTAGQASTFGALKAEDYRVVNESEGGTGSLNFKTARESHTLTLGATSTTSINLPSNVLIYAVQMCVDTAVTDSAGDDTWSAELNDGAGIGTIVTGAAAAQNTKVNKAFVPILTDATTNVVFTPNGGNFSAGAIEVVIYYMDLTSMANAP